MSERCAAADRCVGYDRREQLGAETETSPLCEGCLVAAERAVPALVLDYRDLEAHIPPSMGVRGDGQPGGSGEPRVPIRLDVEALQREIWWLLSAWEDVVRDVDRLSAPVRPWQAHPSARTPQLLPGVDVQRAARILTPRVRRLALLPSQTFWRYPPGEDWSEVSGAQGLVDLTGVHRQAMHAQGLTDARPEPCVGVPCRVCDLKALYREAGEDRVRCGACRASYTGAEYRNWTRLQAAYAGREGDGT